MLPTSLESQFRRYFAPGTEPPTANPSVLYLLRRDVCQCFGFDPATYDVRQNPTTTANFPQVLWPGVMTVFAGIDLIAKFFAGSESEQDPPGTTELTRWKYKSGLRLKKFAATYFTNNNEIEAEHLYQLRCALDHSFALWAQRRNPTNDIYSFTLSGPDLAHPGVLLRTRAGALGEIEVIVDIFELHKRFQKSLISFESSYYTQLDSSAADQTVFQELLDHYGFIGIAEASAFGW